MAVITAYNGRWALSGSAEPLLLDAAHIVADKARALLCCGGKHPNFIIGELSPGTALDRKVPNLGSRLTIVDYKRALFLLSLPRQRKGPRSLQPREDRQANAARQRVLGSNGCWLASRASRPTAACAGFASTA
jgi:hypothetical protein